MAEQPRTLVGAITGAADESKLAGREELPMSNPFDEFRGSPIDWDNTLNMALIPEIGMRSTPEQIRGQIRTSRIDPNDLLVVAATLIEFKFAGHGKVALEEAIRQLDANPSRIAHDIDIVSAKRNLCFLLEATRDSIAQFDLVKKEPKIVQADPQLALAMANCSIPVSETRSRRTITPRRAAAVNSWRNRVPVASFCQM